jgi:hypothetical protein
VAALAVFVFASVCQAAPDDVAIEVDARQRVTISGRGDSLRAAIAELCRRADVRLLAYDAADRPFAARYSSVPLSEALARLLRSEVYLAGVQTKPGTRSTEVTWLRVTGSDGSAVAPHFAADGEGAAGVAPELAAIDLGVSPRTIETALSSPDVGARAAARRSMVIALRENRAPLEQHLAGDPTDLVATLAGYPHAVELAQSLEAVAKDANERTLLRGITHSLRVRHDAEARASAASEPSLR